MIVNCSKAIRTMGRLMRTQLPLRGNNSFGKQKKLPCLREDFFEPQRHRDTKRHKESLCLCGSLHSYTKAIFVAVLLAVSSFVQSQQTFLITSFGAKGDGKTMNTAAIQKAVDAAAQKGGRVVLTTGKFVTGPVELKGGVELHLEGGAALLGTTNRLDYGGEVAKPLLYAKEASGVSITGSGTIDGRGAEVVENLLQQLKAGRLHDDQWLVKRPGESHRPQLLFFDRCKNINIQGITIRNGSGWVQSYLRCDGVTIDSITVESVAYWNNDGIDIVNSKNVAITNCRINAADDAICLKSDGAVRDSCVNIYVANCRLRSSASAFKIGTGSSGGFRNIKVEGLTVYDTYRSAVALEAVDGGFLEDVDISNVKALNTGNAVFIRLGHRNKDGNYSRVRNVAIANVYAEVPAGKPDKGYPMEGPGLKYPTGMKPAKNAWVSVSPWNHSGKDSTAIPYPHNVFPSSITGLPGHPVENISLENIEIVFAGGGDSSLAFFPADSLEKITEAEASYPEFSMFGELPAWGFYVRHADGLVMKNVTIRNKKEDYRTAAIFDDVQRLVLNNVRVPTGNALPVIILNKVGRPSLENIELPVNNAKAIKTQ